MVAEKGIRTFTNVLEAEEYITEKYKNQIVHFWYWHKRKERMEEKTAKVDRVAIDMSRTPKVLLFLTDGTRNEFDKDDFFNDVKIL